MLKDWLARLILRSWCARFLRDAHPLNRLMGRSVLLQSGKITDEEFRTDLESFFQTLDRNAFLREIDFPAKSARLLRPGGYKTDLLALSQGGPGSRRPAPWNLWDRRFGLLRRIGVRSDVLILRQGDQIPPHGHHGVVSGFFVLEGEVAIRHYDRVREVDGAVLVRKALDTTLARGGFTTNSEFFQNIHWLFGLSPTSFLFRVTVTETPTVTFGAPGRTDERVYLNPAGEPDSEGLILAPYVSAENAAAIPFEPVGNLATT